MNFIRDIDLKVEIILLRNSKMLKSNPSLYNNNYNTIQKLLEEYNKPGKYPTQKDILNEASKCFIEHNNDRFGELIIMMIDKFATKRIYANYSNVWLDEMKSYAVEMIFRYIDNFDPYRISSKTKQYVSAFSYITQIISNAFIFTINKLKKDQRVQNSVEYISHMSGVNVRDANKSTYNNDESFESELKFHCTSIDEVEDILKKYINKNINLIIIFRKMTLDEYYKIKTYLDKFNTGCIQILEKELEKTEEAKKCDTKNDKNLLFKENI